MMEYHIYDMISYKEMTSTGRFWLIFLPCLEKSRSIKEISYILNLKKEGGQPKSHLYQGQIANKMCEAGALIFESSLFEKENKFSSDISFLGYNKKINEFSNKKWVKQELFSTEKIMKLYRNESELIKTRGRDFIPLLLTLITTFNSSVGLSKSMKGKYPKSARTKKEKTSIDEQRKGFLPLLFHALYPELDVDTYFIEIFETLLEHEQEIIEFVKNLTKK